MLFFGCCLDVMKRIKSGSVDMVCADLPYGTTQCKWDSVIPLDELWAEYKRVCKPDAAIVLTATQPFTAALVMSNVKAFRHEWIWKKDKGGNIAVMKYQPAKVHESVLVFGFKSPFYNPQMEARPEANRRNNAPRTNRCGVQGDKPFHVERSRGADAVKYPTSVKEYNCVRGGVHPTQKPLELMEYLIRTYSNEGQTVLDNSMGSGTTGVACANTGRRFIGIEKDADFFRAASERISSANSQLTNAGM